MHQVGISRQFHIWCTDTHTSNLMINIRMCFKKIAKLNGGWVFLLQDRDKVPAVVKILINFISRKIQEIPWAAEGQLVSKKYFALYGWPCVPFFAVFRPVVWFVRCLLTSYVSPSKHILRCHNLPLMCADDLSTNFENNFVLLFTSEWI